jgi:protein phosphatase
MGGAAGGEVASRLTVQTILDRMTSDCASGEDALHQAIADANQAVLDHAERDPGLYGMGTTLVALLLHPGSALIAHAGDSRCYLFRDGNLTRCTHDHSLVDEQMRLGTMTQEEAERSPFRSVITRAIGTQKSVMEEAVDMATQPGDVFLLCTDGLTREVNEAQMAEIMQAGGSLEESAGRLIDAANEAGGRDNVTCVLVRVP